MVRKLSSNLNRFPHPRNHQWRLVSMTGLLSRLRINRTISSEDAQVGDTVDFEVLDDVKSHDVVLIPRGGIALRGRVCYFVPEESAMSRALVSALVKYRDDLKHILDLNPGKVDFARVKAEICQRFPVVSLSPFESLLGMTEGAGNSAKAEGRKADAIV